MELLNPPLLPSLQAKLLHLHNDVELTLDDTLKIRSVVPYRHSQTELSLTRLICPHGTHPELRLAVHLIHLIIPLSELTHNSGLYVGVEERDLEDVTFLLNINSISLDFHTTAVIRNSASFHSFQVFVRL